MDVMGADDEAIKATNDDATECKRSAVELGYWQDDYIRYFVKHVERKAPEINRGYYARVRAFEMFIHQFLEVTLPFYRLNKKYCNLVNKDLFLRPFSVVEQSVKS